MGVSTLVLLNINIIDSIFYLYIIFLILPTWYQVPLVITSPRTHTIPICDHDMILVAVPVWYWNSWNSVKPHRGIEEVLTPSKRVLTPSIPWQYPYWVPNTYPIPLLGRYWVPNTCFEKHSLINRELCERSFLGFLKQHDTFYNHVCKVFQQYRIIYNSTEYSWFSA